MKGNGGTNIMGRFLLGVIVCLILIPVAVLGWLRFGKVPVAVADQPFPFEQPIVGIPLEARIQRESIKTPPIQPNEENLTAGAHIYSEKCLICHGFHGKPSVIGPKMYPDAQPLWEEHHHGAETVVGVSDDPPGETYWKVANGIRLTGMPAYRQVLTENEIWQVSLLLANADKPLPPATVEILRGEQPPPAPAPTAKK
jgi:mono/diheme cytochrome c family protein